MAEQNHLKERGLITTGYHLPYNPALRAKVKELRKNMTAAERKLWYGYLRHFKYPISRQRPIDNYIVDFYSPKLKLVIEIDGDAHYTSEGKTNDEERAKILQSYGLKVIRFSNVAVLNNFESVCQELEEQTP